MADTDTGEAKDSLSTTPAGNPLKPVVERVFPTESSDSRKKEQEREVATPFPAGLVALQGKLPDAITGVKAQIKRDETLDEQQMERKAQQESTSIAATEADTQQCPACQKMLPARALFCSTCGYRLSQTVGPAEEKSVQEVTGIVTASPQQVTGAIAAHAASSELHLSSHELVSASEQRPTTLSEVVGTTTHLKRTDVAPVQVAASEQHASQHAQDSTVEQQKTTPALSTVMEPEGRSTGTSAAGVETGENKKGGDEQAEEEEEEGPVATFRKRRIAFKTLNRPLQVLLILTLVQIGMVALLLAIRNIPQPLVDNGLISQGQSFVVPFATFIVVAISFTGGLWFLLAGALRVHWAMRFLVFTLATGVLAYRPLSSLILDATLQSEPYITEVRVRWIQLALLALLWMGAASITLVRWHAKRKGMALQLDIQQWHDLTFWLILDLYPDLLRSGINCLGRLRQSRHIG